MGSDVLVDILEYVAVSQQQANRGEALVRAKKLMSKLRRNGFNSREISELSNNVWSPDTIRVYTIGWGEVDPELARQKDELMGSLRRLAQKGIGVDDIESVLELEKRAKIYGSTLKDVAELESNLGKLGLMPQQVGELNDLNEKMVEAQLNPAMISNWMAKDREFVKEGFTKEVRAKLVEGSKKFGGVPKLQEMVDGYGGRSDLQKETDSMKGVLDDYTEKAEEEGKRFKKYESANRAVATLIQFGWNLNVLTTLPSVIFRTDDPGEFKTAARMCRKIADLQRKLDGLQSLLVEFEKIRAVMPSQEKMAFLRLITALSNKQLEPGAKIRDIGHLVFALLGNYVELASPEINSQEEIELLQGVIGNLNQLCNLTPPTNLPSSLLTSAD